MKVFVTGGMGFIGSYIVMDLLHDGHEVTILARNPQKVPAFATMKGIKIVEGGLADFEAIAKGLKGHDACVHNALYWGNTAPDMLFNDTRCSIQVFHLANEAGVKQMVYTSSTAAMGEWPNGMHEEMKLKPSDFYGATKAATEEYLLAFGAKTQMKCNAVRPGYTIGNPVVPGAHIYSDKRFRQIIKSALAGEEIHLTKYDGTQFVDAADLAKIFTAILKRGNLNRQIYFGLSKNFTTWEAIARQVVEMTGSKSKIVLEDKGWAAEPHLFDLGKIQRDFGFAFDSTKCIKEHLKYLIGEMKEGRLQLT